LVSIEGAELVKRLSKIVGVPFCCILPFVKWITIPSPTYIPVILAEYKHTLTSVSYLQESIV
jgi:hypothetical protein